MGLKAETMGNLHHEHMPTHRVGSRSIVYMINLARYQVNQHSNFSNHNHSYWVKDRMKINLLEIRWIPQPNNC